MLKTPYPASRLFWVFCFGLITITANAAILDTTVKKNTPPPGRSTYSLTETFSAFSDAVAAFKQDSLDKGLHLFSKLFRQSERSKHVMRMADYKGLQVYSFVNDADDGKLSPDEKKILGILFKEGIDQNVSGFNALKNEINKAPSTPFIIHLKLFMLYASNEKQAEKEADKMLKDNPDDIAVNTLKAELLYDNDKYDKSIPYCNKLIALFPQDAHAYELRGKNYEMLSQPDSAIADYDEAIKLFPDNKLIQYHRSLALMDLEKHRDAIPGFLITHSANPDYFWSYYYLAKCYNKLDMADSAFYYVNLHLQQYPDDDDGHDLKGNIYYGKNDYQNAIEQYNQAIRISPSNESFVEDRGDAYFYDQKYTDALTDYTKAIQLDKHRAYLYDQVGDCYYQLKQYKKAISFEELALKADSVYKYAYVGLSMNKVELGDYTGAIADCKSAIAIDSTYDTAIGDLGWDYYCAGDNDACISYSYKALKYDEKATYAMFNIALATLKKGEPEKAKDLYRQFIAECKKKGYAIQDGAVDDLKNLMKKKIAVEDCKFIIQQLFEKPLE